MINSKRVIAIIPARGGSKGLPNKNIKPLCDMPLIGWSIESGLGSQYIDEVMVTTDSEEIAAIARELGASVPFLRPPALATDVAKTFDAIKHVIDFYALEIGEQFDYVVLLEPTSPIREKNDIDTMLEKLATNESDFDAIISIGEVHEHPSIMKKVVGQRIEPFCKELVTATRRQDNDVAYFPYGVAYIIKTKALLQEETFYAHRTTHYLLQRHQCYEIDDLYDFLAIERILKYRKRFK